MTADQLVTLIVSHMSRHPAGGELHIVLSDLNVDDSALTFARTHAAQTKVHEDGCGLHPNVCARIAVAIIDGLREWPPEKRWFLIEAPDIFPHRWNEGAVAVNHVAQIGGHIPGYIDSEPPTPRR